MNDLEKYIISESSLVKDALKKIEINQQGFILIENSQNEISSLATDGDIRSGLLNGITLDDFIYKIGNKDYFYGFEDTPHEVLLKKLDGNIKFIPILDKNKKLVTVLNKDSLPFKDESNVFYRSKSPVRISFGGGGSDVSKYFSEYGGAVINSTISLFSHATLKINKDKKIRIFSLDLNDSIEFKNLISLKSSDNKSFSLINSVISTINPSFGFDLYIRSDYPMSSGLGGSAVVSSAIIGCFNQLRIDKWDLYEISEIAFQAERIQLQISGGWQDQYATVFGGFNFMEFNKNQNIIHPIRMPKNSLLELEQSLILCYTGGNHDSGNIHEDQAKQTKTIKTKDKIKDNVELTYKMRDYLLKGKLNKLGECLNETWKIKRSLSSKISNKKLDQIYSKALENGVVGGKLLGAGGGGYFLFYTNPFDRHKVMKWIEKENLIYTPFVFETNGLQSWTVRN
jgi:D-glycero-alpha-D-manno-heptose-7-phosphate kinase